MTKFCLGTQKPMDKTLTQHLQGVLVHGINPESNYVRLYRSFDNVAKSADLTIFCILSEIEQYRKRNKGKNPKMLGLQLDGGIENSSKIVLAAIEYLSALRIIPEIWYCRLPTGFF